jgi:hypothetical protein
VKVGMLKTKTTKKTTEFILYEFNCFQSEKWFSTKKKYKTNSLDNPKEEKTRFGLSRE